MLNKTKPIGDWHRSIDDRVGAANKMIKDLNFVGDVICDSMDNEVLHPQAGDEIWIPANARHRLSSAGPAVRVLEVAFGNWQQADITRYEDDYARPDQGEAD